MINTRLRNGHLCFVEAERATARVLILGGTADTLELAQRLGKRSDVVMISSLAGRVSQPRLPAGEVRVGGFGGVAGLIAYLETEAIAAVVDATHPYAAQISRNAELACEALGLPMLALARPAWTKTADDLWHEVADVGAAAAFVHACSGKVLLSIGRQGVAAFADCSQAAFVIRSIESPAPPLPAQHTLLLDRGPFAIDDELRLLEQHGIELVVSKNSGGEATYAKIAAARQLRLPVVMIDRPRKHTAAALHSVDEVSAALDRVLAERLRRAVVTQ